MGVYFIKVCRAQLLFLVLLSLDDVSTLGSITTVTTLIKHISFLMDPQIRYTVIANVKTEHLEEYLCWLKNGHVQALIDEGGAVSGEVVQLDASPEGVSRVASNYIFPSRAAVDAYAGSEVASRMRGEGVSMFVDTQKVMSFERLVGPVVFQYSK